MGSNGLGNYLASDEELLLSFTAEKVTRGQDDDNQALEQQLNSSQYQFGATDRRIVYLSESGAFKDIDYQHISSIESDVEEDDTEQGAAVVAGCCGGMLLLGGFGMLSDSPGAAILSILLGGGLLALTVKLFQNAETTEKQKVKFITGDEADQRLEVTLTESADTTIGAELSRILREQR